MSTTFAAIIGQTSLAFTILALQRTVPALRDNAPIRRSVDRRRMTLIVRDA